MEANAQRHQRTQANLDGLRWFDHIVSFRSTVGVSNASAVRHFLLLK